VQHKSKLESRGFKLKNDGEIDVLQSFSFEIWVSVVYLCAIVLFRDLVNRQIKMERDHLKLMLVKAHEEIDDDPTEQADEHADAKNLAEEARKQRNLRDYNERMLELSGEIPRIFIDSVHFKWLFSGSFLCVLLF
jgi:hypothetical protein